jgi:predicted GNAT family acetyltransferase
MRFYTIENLEPHRVPPGQFRPAREDEFDTLLPLAIAAATEMNLPVTERTPGLVTPRLRKTLAEQRQFIWSNNGAIQAIAGYVPSLPDAGARIGGVYTLPEFRGCGCGTAITASLTQLLLDQGQQWVSLFADEANPVSTGIYRRLGYRPHHVVHTWNFE